MSKAFHKFIETGDSGAKKKERIRQEKKQMRKEKKEYFERKKAEARGQRSETGGRRSDARGQKPGGKQSGARSRESGDKRQQSEARYQKSDAGGRRPDTRSQKPEARSQHSEGRKESRYPAQGKQKPGFISVKPRQKPGIVKQPATNKSRVAIQKATPKSSQGQTTNYKPQTGNQQPAAGNKSTTAIQKTTPKSSQPETRNQKPAASVMPLNKFIAHAGVCSRRDAADIVKSGKVVVNGQLVKEPGFKVSQQDEVKVNGKKISARKNLVYILLNKPKDYITTTEDPEGRKTVLDIVRHATTERVYPIGRLDRNTTGVLLLTNDGELAQKLAHPSYQVKKIYEVKLDKPLVKKDFDTIMNGITLEDGLITPDALAYADPKDKSVIGIEIHSGRNRIVRRIFEQLGYDVRNLDRVMYANLTKKNVERGKWRLLSEKEIRLLKFLNASYTRK
jgi:23S rRNA pseudouridine2605 synthase